LNIKVKYKKIGRSKAWAQAFVDKKIIEIDPRAKGKKELELLIHESLHILYPENEEEKVIYNSVSLTKVLWDLGYRKTDNSNNIRLQDGTK
jgi:hypothetical protein